MRQNQISAELPGMLQDLHCYVDTQNYRLYLRSQFANHQPGVIPFGNLGFRPELIEVVDKRG